MTRQCRVRAFRRLPTPPQLPPTDIAADIQLRLYRPTRIARCRRPARRCTEMLGRLRSPRRKVRRSFLGAVRRPIARYPRRPAHNRDSVTHTVTRRPYSSPQRRRSAIARRKAARPLPRHNGQARCILRTLRTLLIISQSRPTLSSLARLRRPPPTQIRPPNTRSAQRHRLE